MNCRNSNTKMKAHVNKHNTKCHIQITIAAALLTNSLRPKVELDDIGLSWPIAIRNGVSARVARAARGGGCDPASVVPATAEPVALDCLACPVAAGTTLAGSQPPPRAARATRADTPLRIAMGQESPMSSSSTFGRNEFVNRAAAIVICMWHFVLCLLTCAFIFVFEFLQFMFQMWLKSLFSLLSLLFSRLSKILLIRKDLPFGWI
jgi:hypothetical protein